MKVWRQDGYIPSCWYAFIMIRSCVHYCRQRISDQAQAGEGCFWLPDIYLDGGDLGIEIVDDQAQIVIAGWEFGREE